MAETRLGQVTDPSQKGQPMIDIHLITPERDPLSTPPMKIFPYWPTSPLLQGGCGPTRERLLADHGQPHALPG